MLAWCSPAGPRCNAAGHLAELGSGLAALRLAGAPPRLLRAPRGDGHVVVDIPGWKAAEVSGAPLRAYLRALGYDAAAGASAPTPATRGGRRPARRPGAGAGRAAGSPVSLVGWSLGGVIAREVARQPPGGRSWGDHLGTPVVGGPASPRWRAPTAHRDGVAADEVIQRLTLRRPSASPSPPLFTGGTASSLAGVRRSLLRSTARAHGGLVHPRRHGCGPGRVGDRRPPSGPVRRTTRGVARSAAGFPA